MLFQDMREAGIHLTHRFFVINEQDCVQRHPSFIGKRFPELRPLSPEFLRAKSPPRIIRIRGRASVIPLAGLFWELEEFNVRIAKENIEPILASGVVPGAPGMSLIAIGPPRPVTRKQFVDRTSSHVTGLHGHSRGYGG